jgi:hypothetical protein
MHYHLAPRFLTPQYYVDHDTGLWCDVTESQMVTINLPALSVTLVLSLMGVQELTARARCVADAVGAYRVVHARRYSRVWDFAKVECGP